MTIRIGWRELAARILTPPFAIAGYVAGLLIFMGSET